MDQPIRTLVDSPAVAVLPNDRQQNRRKKKKSIPDPTNPIQEAEENYRQAQQGLKFNNLNEMLIEPPQRPEIDAERVQKNKGLTKRAAALQMIDSIAGAVQLNRHQDEAVVAPNRIGNIGLAALNNLRELDDQHRIDLQRFNQRSEQVEDHNRNTTHRFSQHNAQVDYDIARKELDQLLSKQEAKNIQNDDQKEWHYQAGLRLITQGRFDEARAHFKEAGMNSETIQTAIQRTSSNRGGSGYSSGSLVAGVDIDPRMQTLYEEYQHYRKNISNADYMRDRSGSPDFDNPKRGTPAWEAENLRKLMGDDFYLIDYARRPEREAFERQKAERIRQSRSQQLQNSPEIQQKQRQANITMQRTLLQNVIDSHDYESRLNATTMWLERNRQMLKADGIPEDQVDRLSEEMFVHALQDARSDSSSGQQGQRAGHIQRQGATNAPADSTGQKPEIFRQNISELSDEEFSKTFGNVKSIADLEKIGFDQSEIKNFQSKFYKELMQGTQMERSLKNRLIGLVLGYDTAGRRYKGSLADVLQSPIIMSGRAFKEFKDLVERRQKEFEKQAPRLFLEHERRGQ